MKKRDPQKIALVLWFLFALFFCSGAVNLGIGTPREPGPGFMPLLIGIFLGSIALITLAVMRRQEKSRVPPAKLLSWEDLHKPARVYGALIAYGVLLPLLGYLLSTSALMLFLFKGIEPQKWITSMIATVLTVGFSYAIFGLFLGCQFPILPKF